MAEGSKTETADSLVRLRARFEAWSMGWRDSDLGDTLRRQTNILKRLLIHAGGFNLGLVMRRLIGSGTPRGLQGRPATVIDPLLVFLSAPQSWLAAIFRIEPTHSLCALVSVTHHHHRQLLAANPYTTGC